jgi:hypothetical protein
VRITFYIAGAVLELGGIMLVGWPDVLPYAARVSRWLRSTTRRLVDPLRRALGLRRGHVVQVASAGGVTVGGFPASGIVSLTPDATLEEQVAYLLRREQEAQVKLNALDDRLRGMEDRVPKRLDALRAETEQHVADEISAAESRYRPLRFVGALALALGLALTTIANFA